MFKLDDKFLVELGLGTLPPAEKNKMLAHIYETLEMRVGMKLAEKMSNDQLDEFEAFINNNNESGALKWLEGNFPNYKQVVAEELEKLKTEIKAAAPQIVAQSSAAHPPQAQVVDSQSLPRQQPQQPPAVAQQAPQPAPAQPAQQFQQPPTAPVHQPQAQQPTQQFQQPPTYNQAPQQHAATPTQQPQQPQQQPAQQQQTPSAPVQQQPILNPLPQQPVQPPTPPSAPNNTYQEQ